MILTFSNKCSKIITLNRKEVNTMTEKEQIMHIIDKISDKRILKMILNIINEVYTLHKQGRL